MPPSNENDIIYVDYFDLLDPKIPEIDEHNKLNNQSK